MQDPATQAAVAHVQNQRQRGYHRCSRLDVAQASKRISKARAGVRERAQRRHGRAMGPAHAHIGGHDSGRGRDCGSGAGSEGLAASHLAIPSARRWCEWIPPNLVWAAPMPSRTVACHV